MEKNEPEFQRILRLISQIGGGDIQAVQLYHKAMYSLMRRYIAEPHHSVLTNLYIPQEILHAMDLAPLFIEYIAGTMATARRSIELLEVAEQVLQTTGFCNYIVSAYGIFENKHLPPPKFFIVASEICEDASKVFEHLSWKYKSKYFYLDIPFAVDEKAIDYVASQFEAMVKFIEKQTGKRLDNARLMEAIRFSNQAREYGLKAREIRKYPIPLMHGISAIQIMGVNALFGSRSAVDILKNLYEQLKERKETGKNCITDAKHRIYWVHLFPPYATKLMRYLEQTLHAVIVGDELMDVPKLELDESDPFRSLAKKILNHPVHGVLMNRIENIVDAALDYNADGVIAFSPMGCRIGRSIIPSLKEELNKNNISFLELTGDNIDFRNYSKSQIETRIDAFIEIIEEKKAIRG